MAKWLSRPLHLAILVILLLVAALYGYAEQQQQRYDAAARAYLHGALAGIGQWQVAALQTQLDAEALAAIDNTQLEALVLRYRPLGDFIAVDELQFGRLAAALSLLSRHTLLSYSGQARFQQGSAHLTATLILRDGQFRLYNFNLGEPVLRR
jgi:succinylglutamate desuccinylase